MAAVGLLPFARTALAVATAVLPPSRSQCSKHRFSQSPLLAMVDPDRQPILARGARPGPGNDWAHLRPLRGAANQVTRSGLVLADAECDRERDHLSIRQTLRARSVIRGVRAQMRRAFPSTASSQPYREQGCQQSQRTASAVLQFL